MKEISSMNMWGYSLWFRKSLQFKHPLNLVLLLFLSRRDKKNWGAKSMETLLSKQMQLSSFTYTHKKNAKLQFWKELSVFKRTCMLKDLTQIKTCSIFPYISVNMMCLYAEQVHCNSTWGHTVLLFFSILHFFCSAFVPIFSPLSCAFRVKPSFCDHRIF